VQFIGGPYDGLVRDIDLGGLGRLVLLGRNRIYGAAYIVKDGALVFEGMRRLEEFNLVPNRKDFPP